MWKINKERLASGLKVGIILFGLLFGIFFVFFGIPLSVIENEKILHIYIPSVILVILLPVLVILYYSCLAYKNNKPKYIDGKYVWKDGRIYEGDRDKKCGANGKGKLTWSDGSYYEGEFKNGNISGKGKKYSPSGENYEGDWENGKANGKGKLTRTDGSHYEGEFKDGMFSGKGKIMFGNGGHYEGEFKDGKPHGMGIIKMNNGYYYEGEFFEGKIKGKFKKQVLTTGGLIEGEFRDNGNKSFDGVGKVITSDGFVFEGIFQNGKLNGEGKMITPERAVLLGTFENGDLKTGKQILKNGEYSEGNRDNGYLTGVARYYFKDGSYYEGEYKRGWKGTGTYIAKNGDKYQTEFPYEIINFFMNWLNSKMKEIQGNLNYIPKSEKEKIEERDRYLEISEKGTSIQKEIAEIFLDLGVEGDKFLELIKKDRGINNYISAYSNINDYYINVKNECKNLLGKHHIKSSSKGLYSYGEFFSKLDLSLDGEIKLGDLLVKVFKFLDPEYVLDFIVKKDKKDKEWIRLIDDFSQVYGKDIQLELDWREYEKKFWNHNFKPTKEKKHDKTKNQNRPIGKD